MPCYFINDVVITGHICYNALYAIIPKNYYYNKERKIMFILFGTIGALIITAIEIILFCAKRKPLKIIHTAVRNIFIINLISIALLKYVFKYKHFLDTSTYGTENYLKFFALSLVVGFVCIIISAFVNRYLTFESGERKKTHATRFVKLLSCFLFMLGCAAFFGTVWGKDSFGDVTSDQLVINLFSPMEGADTGVYLDVFERPVFQTMLCTAVFSLFVYSDFNVLYHGIKKNLTVFNDLIHRIVSLVLGVIMLVSGLAYGTHEFQLKQLYNAYVAESDFIADNYVDPRKADIVFPEKKRNIIHIYLESMENSYLSKDLGGYMDENLMPELTKLAYEGYVFSNTDKKFGGPLQGTGTQWSVASMVNMTTGLPMKVPAERNAYGSKDNFLPGAYTFGDMLRDQGYEQTVMFGADAKFGGLLYYFESHGNYKIFDYGYAVRNGLIPKDYKEWWGFEDDKLYEFAKQELTRLYETGKPFNFTMETADTHRPHGYLSKNAPTPYSDQYSNVIAYSSSETVEFVRWIQHQPFYDNTTIVLIGDHLSMDTDFFENFDKNYLRTQFNLIINPAPNVVNTPAERFINRQYCNFDMFPTILSSMGVEIKGNRLGLGTNLFSDEPTLFEEYGFDYVNNELEKKSDFINQNILVDPSKPQEATTAEDAVSKE